MSGGDIPHPYYPRSLKLPHYIPNDKPLAEILGVFFGLVGVVLVLTWLYTNTKPHLRGHTITRLKTCWFLCCGLIHTILEGFFAVKSKTLAGEQSYLAQMWKEYGKGDSRYVSGDNFMVCMEGITGFVDGPLAFIAAYAFLRNKPYRFVVQLLLSLCQLYGDTLYFLTEIREGFTHSEMYHPLYFWFYFVFLNSLWIIIPLCCIIQAARVLTDAQQRTDSVTKKMPKKNKSK